MTNKGKVKVGIIGTGNIGSDLLVKVQRSPYLECSIFAGKNPESEGIKRAQKIGVPTSFQSIDAIVKNPDMCEIVFDATSADAHLNHAPILKKMKKFTVDMTPSRVGKMCVPLLNLEECLMEANVNMVTCGGQATTPLIWAIKQVQDDIEYVEIVASIASKSAGMGTRNNIDEYTQATAESIRTFTGVPKSKAIIILNPADPPIIMHNTIFIKTSRPKLRQIKKVLATIVKQLQEYVPGYSLTLEPVVENGRMVLMNEVIGRGDFLPIFAGNLDIINCAAIKVAEEYAKRKLL